MLLAVGGLAQLPGHAHGRPKAVGRIDGEIFRAREINVGMPRYGRLLRIIFFIVSIEARTDAPAAIWLPFWREYLVGCGRLTARFRVDRRWCGTGRPEQCVCGQAQAATPAHINRGPSHRSAVVGGYLIHGMDAAAFEHVVEPSQRGVGQKPGTIRQLAGR
jgi:hypothetical protein